MRFWSTWECPLWVKSGHQARLWGPTIIWNLRPADPAHWKGGWFYNADDGRTYRLNMGLQSDDVIIARVYVGIPFFGEIRTLVRVPMGTSAGMVLKEELLHRGKRSFPN